jgi:hypothetical protein
MADRHARRARRRRLRFLMRWDTGLPHFLTYRTLMLLEQPRGGIRVIPEVGIVRGVRFVLAA